MNYLIIFDSFIDTGKIPDIAINDGDRILLFPLTSSDGKIGEVSDKIKVKGKGYIIESVKSAKLVNEAADKLRDSYIEFIADISGHKLKNGKTLKEYFSVDRDTSLWWFSLLAEKNTLKTDSFQRLAQLDAIINVATVNRVQHLFYGCKSSKLKETLRLYARKKQIRFEVLSVNKAKNLRDYVREFHKFLYIKHILHLFLFLFNLFIKINKIKNNLGNLKRNSPNDEDLMIITYYPHIDILSAGKGVFKNRYYSRIQEALLSQHTKIVWICMHVENNSVPFDQSLDYAERFIKNGEILYFLDEFLPNVSLIKGLFTVLLAGIKFRMIEKEIVPLHTFGEYNFYEILKQDWYASFVGHVGFAGLMYYESFKCLLIRKNMKRLLYYCEMHAWEKALISARNSTKSKIKLFAYQHATVPWMLLNYFNSPNEVNDTSRFSIPKPDMIICNGDLTYQYMRDCRWPEDKLTIAEAIRFDHLKASLMLPRNKDQNVVLVVLSISVEWSSALLKMTMEAIKDIREIEVWVKPHPFLEMQAISHLLENVEMQSRIQVKKEPIEQLLSEVKIIIIDESSVALEALAFGCAVIIVNMPETVNMSPLRNIKAEMIKTVNSVSELEDTVVEIMKDKMPDRENWHSKANEIVNQFFYLDYESEFPEKMLKIFYN